MADRTWTVERDGNEQYAALGPLTLQITRHRDAKDWWRNETLGWSWRFGPSTPSVFASTCGRMITSIKSGGHPPNLLSEEEAKRQCREAALAWGHEIVAAGTPAP